MLGNVNDRIKMVPVCDILKEKFFIPSYQRGYRWTKEQVTKLLEDIEEFRLKKSIEQNSFYCLQPIVVAKRGEEWEVLDGQQRLTTIHIILKVLENYVDGNYSLRYETRDQSRMFLENLEEKTMEEAEENIDYFHIFNAYHTIVEWFDGSKQKMNKFAMILTNDDNEDKSVKFIWYDVSNEKESEKNAIDIFTRINIGKISLTNAELIKALFLKQEIGYEDSESHKQYKLATEWDYIEKRLHDDSFWYFIYNDTNKLTYETRIEYILDLISEKDEHQEFYFTFNHFYNLIQDSKVEAEKQWLKIKDYVQFLEEWYEHREYYHLIGFLIDCGESISNLKKMAKGVRKSSFVKAIKTLISKQVSCNLDELFYNDNDKVRKVLLLFNIQTILSTTETDIKFPFHLYKKNQWDIEHIRSQTDRRVEAQHRKDWIKDILGYFLGFTSDITESDITKIVNDDGKDLCIQLYHLLDLESVNEAEFKNIYALVEKKFSEEKELEEKDHISNLALLDAHTNRSYGNAFFPIKRSVILRNDASGIFIPLATKNVFLKSYSHNLDDVMHWSEQDAQNYSAAIKGMLTEYICTADKGVE